MPADRLLPTHEAEERVAAAREFARRELLPRAAGAEAGGELPRAAFRAIGQAGIFRMPHGADETFEAYLQVLEELASAWAGVAFGVSVHVVSCLPLARHGTPEQRDRWLAAMLGGARLGAFALSEDDAGSDPAAMTARAAARPGGWMLTGRKAWVTHGGAADFYTLFARTSDDRSRGISCFLVPGDADGLRASPVEGLLGLTAASVATLELDQVRLTADRLVGDEGAGLAIALEALDTGRLGVAAVAVGLAQAALDAAVAYAAERATFGRRIVDHQGLGFLLADMAAAVAAARATTLDAARRRDRGVPFGPQASIAKLVATDAAMRVTTDAVQVLGAAGYTSAHAVERYMREAKALQILEGTNQIQRLLIARDLARR